MVACTNRHNHRLALAAVLASALATAGCSSQIADYTPVGSADGSSRVKEVGTYLPVHDIPPQREESIIPPEQRAKIEADLIAARDRQASATREAGKEGAAK